MVISWAVVMSLFGAVFFYLMYILLSVVISVFENIGKDKFVWYGQHLDNGTGKSVPYDSFKDMLKGGINSTLRIVVVGFVISLIVMTCVALNG